MSDETPDDVNEAALGAQKQPDSAPDTVDDASDTVDDAPDTATDEPRVVEVDSPEVDTVEADSVEAGIAEVDTVEPGVVGTADDESVTTADSVAGFAAAQLDPADDTWWRSAIFYQIYPRSFSDLNGDGVGDLAGVIDKLGYLELLGVDALWLSPIMRSPMADHGYDVSDPRDIDPLFGDLEVFDELIEEAHAREIRVTMDLVPNHTSDQHQWFIDALAAGPDLSLIHI